MPSGKLWKDATNGDGAMWLYRNLLCGPKHGAAAESAGERIVTAWCVAHANASSKVGHVDGVSIRLVLQSAS
jgi:hypothetical protein